MPERSSGARVKDRKKRLAKLPLEMQERLREFELSCHDIREDSRDNYSGRAQNLGEWLVLHGIRQYEKAEKKHLDAFLSTYSNPSTKNLYIQVFRRLYGTLRPEILTDLKVSEVGLPLISPADVLTVSEVVSLAQECGKKREMMRPLVLVLFETACRIGELLNLRKGDVTFSTVKDHEGKRKLIATLFFRRSKGGVRKEPTTCVMFSADLKRWVDSQKANEDDYLFPSPIHPNQPISQENVADTLWYAGQRLNLKKRVNPHFLRHSSLSHLANSKGYSDEMLKIRAGWTTTAMAPRYIHTGAEIEKRVYLEKMGLIEEDKPPEQQITSKTCMHCQAPNSALNDVCDVCLYPLDPVKYQEEVERRKNVERLAVNIDNLAEKKLTEEQQNELKKRTDTCLALLELGRDDLVREYISKLLEHWTKAFLVS